MPINWFGWLLVGYWILNIGIALGYLAVGDAPENTPGSLALQILIMIVFIVLFFTVGVS